MIERLPRSTPEAQGIPTSAIQAFLDGIQETVGELHSLMIVRHGNVVAQGWWEPYSADLPHILYSLSKSFTSTAAGLAIAEGYFTLNDPVISFFPEQLPAKISPNLAAMQVRHLLMMGTGHTEEPTLWAATDGDWVRAFLAPPVEKEPGTHFLYNTPATYMVSAIVQKTTGQDLITFLTPRLFNPLGIEGATWEVCPRGIAFGGSGLRVRTEDIAAFGQMYLQKGVWNGQRILSEEWVETATSRQISNGDDPENDWNQGYGFQFWRCRHGAYRGDGAFGQYCVVLPEQDAVIAITSGIGDMGSPLRLVWERLLPAMASSPLPADAAGNAQLHDRLASLIAKAPVGESASPTAANVSGKTFHFGENDQNIETITLSFNADGGSLLVRDEHGEHSVAFSTSEWRRGSTTFLQRRMWQGIVPTPDWKVAGQGAWTTSDTFTVRLAFYNTPFCPTLTFDFVAGKVTFTLRGNIGFGPSERAPIVGE